MRLPIPLAAVVAWATFGAAYAGEPGPAKGNDAPDGKSHGSLAYLVGYALKDSGPCWLVREHERVQIGHKTTVGLTGGGMTDLMQDRFYLHPTFDEETARKWVKLASSEGWPRRSRNCRLPTMAKAETAKDAVAQIAAEAAKPGKDSSVIPYLPILVDWDPAALRAFAGKTPWHAQGIDEWVTINGPGEIVKRKEMRQEPSDAALAAATMGEMSGIVGANANREGVFLVQGAFEMATQPEDLNGESAGLRFMVRRVTQKDLDIPAALKGSPSFTMLPGHGGDGPGDLEGQAFFHVDVAGRNQHAIQTEKTIADGNWHSVEIVWDLKATTRVEKHTFGRAKVWVDGVGGSQQHVAPPDGHVGFSARQPVLVASVQVTHKPQATSPSKPTRP